MTIVEAARIINRRNPSETVVPLVLSGRDFEQLRGEVLQFVKEKENRDYLFAADSGFHNFLFKGVEVRSS